MRIVINALSARVGGGQTYLHNLLRRLDGSEGIEARVYVPDTFPDVANPAVTIVRERTPARHVPARLLWEQVRLPQILRRSSADLLFCPGGLVNTDPPRGCRTVTMCRNMLPFDPAQRARFGRSMFRGRMWLQRRAMLASMLRADLVIFVSEHARRRIEADAGRPLRRAVMIPHGIDERFRPEPDALLPRPAWLPAEEYLLYVSTLFVYKNQVEVVRAFELLKRRRGGPETLVLVGSGQPSYERVVRQEIERLGLRGAVVLAGHVPYDELPAVYRHAKVNVFASECENCPNTVLEALGSGRPLVVSNRAPMPEFAGDAALYFDPASPADLAQRILEVIDRPDALSALGRRAREHSLRYSWDETARRTWRALRAAAEGAVPAGIG